jgi:hypothetical protein
MNEVCRPEIRNENTRRVEKLLFFEMTVDGSFQDSETGLLGHGDGHPAGKFRRTEGLHDLTLHLLAARRAGGEIHLLFVRSMLESISTQLAR